MFRFPTLYNRTDEEEVEYIADLYTNPSEVKNFIRTHCHSTTGKYWLQEDLQAYLEANGFVRKESSDGAHRKNEAGSKD